MRYCSRSKCTLPEATTQRSRSERSWPVPSSRRDGTLEVGGSCLWSPSSTRFDGRVRRSNDVEDSGVQPASSTMTVCNRSSSAWVSPHTRCKRLVEETVQTKSRVRSRIADFPACMRLRHQPYEEATVLQRPMKCSQKSRNAYACAWRRRRKAKRTLRPRQPTQPASRALMASRRAWHVRVARASAPAMARGKRCQPTCASSRYGRAASPTRSCTPRTQIGSPRSSSRRTTELTATLRVQVTNARSPGGKWELTMWKTVFVLPVPGGPWIISRECFRASTADRCDSLAGTMLVSSGLAA
mmetsp:Transcript_42027/g.119887  ORF Transcript_42027/g.119887 Transcript_42027/m.119887 type:complete len:299 (+) Transcript_42027:837-1733(+)